MWDDQKRKRFQQLRQGHDALTANERLELAQLEAEIEALESQYLSPATERIREERRTLESQTRALEILAARKEALANRLHDVLVEAQAERQAIQGELTALLTAVHDAKTDQ